MSQVWELDLPHNQAWVLMALTDWADDDGANVFPSIGLIAWKTGYERRNVQRIMGALRRSGILSVVAHATGGRAGSGVGHPTEYRIDLTKGDKKSPYESDQARATSRVEQGRHLGSPRATSGVVKGDSHATQPTREPLVNQQEEPPEYILILRAIPGWPKKGNEISLAKWVKRKPYSDDQLEASAIGLAKTKTRTLSGYNRLDRAFQDRLLKGYDAPGQNGSRPDKYPSGSNYAKVPRRVGRYP